MASPLLWPLIATDRASTTFNRVAGAMDRTAAAGTRATTAVDRASKRMAVVGKAMTKNITVPFVAAAGVAVDQAMKFQQATNVYVTAAGESSKNLKVVQAGIKRIAVETGTSIDNLTSAGYLVEKAGLRGAAGVKVLDAAAKGAREENAQLSDVVQAMTSVMASYHLKASQAVQVMNALKTGAGQAKVTMEQYAGALSTVIPIASANRISLQQVLGAFSTLTQHGTEAREATQELASTIRSLAAPNRVAMNQMQQLGLSVNDVTKNIGKRGLTGTIDLLVGAITDHMGKAGLVIQKAFNQSASAGADVQVMLKQMPGQVQTLAKEYLKGGLSLDDWRTKVKKLPTDQASLAKQFQTLADKAKGFNTLLRTGDPAAQTFTSALRKMAGGAIGLNTILQLAGENTDGFHKRVDEVGHSLHNTSKEVEGWGSTSKLAAVRFDIMKEKLQVAAINLGDQLLPVFTKLVDGLSSAVDWFTHLTGTQKSILGWSTGVLVAMGPILSIGSKLMLLGRTMGRFTTGTSAMLTRLAGTSFTTSARINTAVGGITGALGGAAIGLTVASFTRNASTTVQWLSALGSAAAGAALGFGAGGPVGAILGGLAGGFSAIAGSLFDIKDKSTIAADAAAGAMARVKTNTASLLATLKSVNGEYGKVYRNAVIEQLMQKRPGAGYHYSALGAAGPAGVNPATVTNAALGDPKAVNHILEVWNRVNRQVDDLYKHGQGVPARLNKQMVAINDLVAQLQDESPALKNAEHQWETYHAAQGKSLVTAKQLNQGLKGLDVAIAKNGTGLTTSNQKLVAQGGLAVRNTKVIGSFIRKLDQQTAAIGRQGGGVEKMKQVWDRGLSALRDNLVHKMGFAAGAVDRLFAKFAKPPKPVVLAAKTDGIVRQIGDIQTRINRIRQGKVTSLAANPLKALWTIDDLQKKINGLTQKVPPNIDVNDFATNKLKGIAAWLNSLHNRTIGVTLETFHTVGSGPAQASPRATGGAIRGPGGPTADRVPIWASNGEHMLTASDVNKVGGQGAVYRMRSAIQSGMLRFAGGGAITHSGDSWIFEPTGERYASRRAALNAQTAYNKTHSPNKLAGTAVGDVGNMGVDKFTLGSASQFNRVMGQIRHAWKVLAHEIDRGLGDKAADRYKRLLKQYTQEARRQMVGLAVGNIGNIPQPKFTLSKVGDYRVVMRQISHGWDVLRKQIANGLSKSAADHFRTLLKQYTEQAKRQVAELERQALRSPLLKQLAKVNASLSNAKQRLATVQSNYNAMRSGIADTVRGTFDIGSAGVGTSVYNDQKPPPITGSSILAQLTKAANQAKRFGNKLRQLKKLGLAKPLLITLAQAGPSALPQAVALANAPDATLSKINAGYKDLSQYGTQAGKLAAGLKYNDALSSAKTLVHGLEDKRAGLKKALSNIAKETAKELVAEIEKQGKKGGQGGKGGDTHHHYNVHGPNAEAVAAAIIRRQKHHAQMVGGG